MATVIPVLLAAWWVLRVQGRLWRQTVAQRAGAAIEELQQALGGEVRPRWTGWELRAGGVRIAFLGGLRGPWTRIRAGERRARRQGHCSAHEVRAVLREWERSSEPASPS